MGVLAASDWFAIVSSDCNRDQRNNRITLSKCSLLSFDLDPMSTVYIGPLAIAYAEVKRSRLNTEK